MSVPTFCQPRINITLKNIEKIRRTSMRLAKVNAIAFDPYTHGYYKVTERVGEAFKDGLKLK